MTGQAGRAISRVDSERLMETTATIARWERLSGSDDERKAFDYIQSDLQSFGYDCQRYEPVCLVSIPRRASLFVNDNPAPIECITHSFSASTPPSGVEFELVEAGAGSVDDFRSVDARAKAILTEGLATPNTVAPSEAAGAGAVIHNSGAQIHEMIISPVWGSPTPATMPMLPTIPHISVNHDGARQLRAALQAGPANVRITTVVDTRWMPIPLLVADAPGLTQHSMHVLLSGHVDSWYFGAMDNGSANASMLEVARIMIEHQEEMRRGLRLAFWSGHSHARYGASAWYADEFWSFTHHFCLAHVNIDSPGGVGAEDLSASSTMAESYPIAREIFQDVAGANLRYERIGRMGDQSFWGTGVPSFYCSISQQPPGDAQTGIGALLGRGGGLGWWWHTADDTLDKIDPENLVRDAQILLATVYRLCTERRLSYDQSFAAAEIRETLESLQKAAGEDLDLSSSIELAKDLEESARRLRTLPLDDEASDDELALYNGCVTGVSRILIPVNYTISGEFEHDPAIPGEPLPGLQPMRQLPRQRDIPNAYYPWLTKLRRERNRVNQAMLSATTLIEQTLAVFQMDDD